jgi:L-alanine-DL-glutamate epimerase-like enolase superfamily enzyme
MQDDILVGSLPITNGPNWRVPEGAGLCIEVSEDKLARYHGLYRERGQFLPYDPSLIGKEL